MKYSSGRRVTSLAIILATLTVLAAPAFAGKTYFVRTSGNDGQAGTSPEAAFATIQKAVSMCTDFGNTIYVGPGTYSEEVYIGYGAGASAGSGAEGAPNRIVGDLTGAATGDEGGAVIIDGGDARTYGFRLQQRDYWSLEYLTVKNQASYGIYSFRCNDLTLRKLNVNVPRYYGMYIYFGDDLKIQDNRMIRDAATSGHGMWVYGSGGSNLIEGTRFLLTGADYLSYGYKNGFRWRGNGRRTRYAYGIIYFGWTNSPSTATIRNNVVSDCYLGIYGYAYSSNAVVNMTNNTATGCLYGCYAYGYAGTVRVADTIVTDSYYGVGAYTYRGSLHLSGLITNEITRDSVLTYNRGRSIVEGVLEDTDPMFVDAAAGNYDLQAGSPAIDAATGLISITTDIRGWSRPIDGNEDSTPLADMGAWEYDPAAGVTRPRLVHWTEQAPD